MDLGPMIEALFVVALMAWWFIHVFVETPKQSTDIYSEMMSRKKRKADE